MTDSIHFAEATAGQSRQVKQLATQHSNHDGMAHPYSLGGGRGERRRTGEKMVHRGGGGGGGYIG